MKKLCGIRFCLIVWILALYMAGCSSVNRESDKAVQGSSIGAALRKKTEEVVSRATEIEQTAAVEPEETLPQKEENESDIPPFLTFDWTADEVLLGHSIQPEDSARGWVFSLADVDFDGSLELLITFTANHCGGDSLYIYKQDEESVFSLTDTYATFREDVVWISKEGHEELSPYFDIGLLDAYVNEEGEYRYLSLDYTLFGGGPWNNGFGELYLYVTTFKKDAQPMKLAEIHFDENEYFEGMEIYFREEKVDTPEKLHELLEQYMAGYTKVEMEYKTSEVSFPRDIVGFNENEKKQCLEELYGSLKEFLECESNRNKQYLCKTVEEGYELTIYNSSGAIILSEVYPKEPGISRVTENVMEIATSVGSPARYVYYIDLEEDKVSDVFFNPILVGDKYIAYMEDGKLILSDIFYTDQQEGLLYMTIDRDFYKAANPMSAIVGIEPIGSGIIELEYLNGEDCTVTEVMQINMDMDTEPTGTTYSSDELNIYNPYFYDKEEIFLQATARHVYGGVVEKAAYINVDMIQAYENGYVYKFTVDIDKDEDDFWCEEDRFNQFFYVTEDKIYIVPSRINIPSEGLKFDFNEDVHSLTEMFDTDEKLIEWSTVVCQEDEKIEDEEWYYRSITKTGNQITYYAYSLRASGDVLEVYYYTWQKGKGLVSFGYRYGVGAGYDLMLYDIEE